jgi:hypothetical protein
MGAGVIKQLWEVGGMVDALEAWEGKDGNMGELRRH